MLAEVARHLVLQVDDGVVEIDRREVVDRVFRTGAAGFGRADPVVTEAVARQDGVVRVVQFQPIGAGAEELVVVDQHGFLRVAREGRLNGVVPNRPGGAGGERGTVGFTERHGAAEGHVLDVQAPGRDRGRIVGQRRVKHHLDAL